MTKRDDLPSLLLLPFPPEPSSRQALNAAYRSPITAALLKLKSQDRSQKLFISVTCPILNGKDVRSKKLSWYEVQSLVAGVYNITSVLCLQLGIGIDVDGGPGVTPFRRQLFR